LVGILGLLISFYHTTLLAQSLPAPMSPRSLFYTSSIDIAQYALHEGGSRSANLIEGFIPLYPRGPQNLLFTDIRFYNPNSTPLEGNVDLGFRRLFQGHSRLYMPVLIATAVKRIVILAKFIQKQAWLPLISLDNTIVCRYYEVI
jgi:hypothetical protein